MTSPGQAPPALPPVGAVDVVIPVYKERGDVLRGALAALRAQTHPVGRIFVIDDGSPEPVVLPGPDADGVCLLRLPANGGISAARNHGIDHCNSDWILTLNAEIEPAADWLEVCTSYVAAKPKVAAVYSRIVSHTPRRLLSRWRMRFHEEQYGNSSGIAKFAPGHIVLFRRDAIRQVGGYDATFRRAGEDFDICSRLKAAGWETHYLSTTAAVSFQVDDLPLLTRKTLVRLGWLSGRKTSLPQVLWRSTRFFIQRLGRNLLQGRWDLVPVDFAVWLGGIRVLIGEAK